MRRMKRFFIKYRLSFKKLSPFFDIRWICSVVSILTNFVEMLPGIIMFFKLLADKISKSKKKTKDKKKQQARKTCLELRNVLIDPFFAKSCASLLDSLQIVNTELSMQKERLTWSNKLQSNHTQEK